MWERKDMLNLFEYCDKYSSENNDYLKAAILGVDDSIDMSFDLENTEWETDLSIYRFDILRSVAEYHVYVDLSFFSIDTIWNEQIDGDILSYRGYKFVYHLCSDKIAIAKGQKKFTFGFRYYTHYLSDILILDKELYDIRDIYLYFSGANKFIFKEWNERFRETTFIYKSVHLDEEDIKKLTNYKNYINAADITYTLSLSDFMDDFLVDLKSNHRSTKSYIMVVLKDETEEELIDWFKKHLERLKDIYCRHTPHISFYRETDEYTNGPGMIVHKDGEEQVYPRVKVPYLWELDGFSKAYTMYVIDRL